MRALLAAALVVVTGGVMAGCATTDIKGRERTRVGPLRGASVVAAHVPLDPVRIDAGTNVLTDAELAALAAELPVHLNHAFQARASTHGDARAVGTARVLGCRIDAGPGRAYTVYEARCRVALVLDDVTLIEVHTQALRRTRSRAIGEAEAKEIAKLERNPLLSVDDTRAALLSALDAATLLIANDALPPSSNGRVPDRALEPGVRRTLALARYDKARRGEGDVRAALHDLSEAGLPVDATAIARDMDAKPASSVSVDEIRALAVLCAPETRASLDRLVADPEPTQFIEDVARGQRALDACARLPPR